MFLGIEIGGTKLQLGLGEGDGTIVQLWRGTVDPALGGAGIRAEIVRTYAGLLQSAGLQRSDIRGIGVGFGGPTDDATQSTITSHQIAGWDNFPLAGFLRENLGAPAVICNDADVAGLAEAHFGAGKGLSPIFYITVGTGIGGGLIIDGKIYRGVGRGAAEIGHTMVGCGLLQDDREMGRQWVTLEDVASGWGIAKRARRILEMNRDTKRGHRSSLRDVPSENLDTKTVAEHARGGDPYAKSLIEYAVNAIADALVQTSKLICPKRYVIGGGVSLIGDDFFFGPLRATFEEDSFGPFAGLTDIVPAALGEEVVVHGALTLARQHFGG